ncbi:cyclophilin-like protein [Clavulina sp. PMI_390]|nr:cyclophilin-like protein [Clavulina sp. PMI_390]
MAQEVGLPTAGYAFLWWCIELDDPLADRISFSGRSIYGRYFMDEDLSRPFTCRGQVAMANAGPNTNGSQFFITFGACPYLNGQAVIFGQLVDQESYNILARIEAVAVDQRTSTPIVDIVIADCGEV